MRRRPRERVTLYQFAVSSERWEALTTALTMALYDVLDEYEALDSARGMSEAERDRRFQESEARIDAAAEQVAFEIVTAALPFLDCPDSVVRDGDIVPGAQEALYDWFSRIDEQHGHCTLSYLLERALEDGRVERNLEYVEVRRQTLSPTRRAALIESHGGRCAKCSAKDVPLEIDHKVPWAISRNDDDSNLWPLCVPCHRAKTVKDRAAIRRHRRKQAADAARAEAVAG